MAATFFHHGLGTWIRNEWGLWSGTGPLYEYLASEGLWHADDMSGVILTSYWRHHHGIPLDVDAQVAGYLHYWATLPPLINIFGPTGELGGPTIPSDGDLECAEP